VGLVTNGRSAGEGSAILPVTRNPQQLATLLETLARMQMEPVRDLLVVFRHHLRLPWGISCLYFALENDEAARTAKDYFTQRRIPFVFYAGHPSSDSAEALVSGGPDIQGLAELRAGEDLD
jgi:hypothetical protein